MAYYYTQFILYAPKALLNVNAIASVKASIYQQLYCHSNG